MTMGSKQPDLDLAYPTDQGAVDTAPGNHAYELFNEPLRYWQVGPHIAQQSDVVTLKLKELSLYYIIYKIYI